MEEINYPHVEASIGHTFQNRDLLRQAFTRRSYAQEHGGGDNEILEFIGDKALDLAVVQLLIREFGKMEDGSSAVPAKSTAKRIPLIPQKGSEFVCLQDEGELTKLKSRMVSKHYLARKMDDLGFAKYIIMGAGDQKSDVGSEASVKEDLFEAILGAVTLDCGWDLSKIVSVVEAMLRPDNFFLNNTYNNDDNYIELIQEWNEAENHARPQFYYQEGYSGLISLPYHFLNAETNHGLISQNAVPNYSSNMYQCDMFLSCDFPLFREKGVSKSEARMNVCKLAYEYLLREGYIEEKSIRDEIGEPTEDFAINQLEILARRDYFSLPKYDFSQEYDKDGNPIWQYRCSIEEFPPQFGKKGSSKKSAKKSAAMKMLLYVLDNYEKRQNEEDIQN